MPTKGSRSNSKKAKKAGSSVYDMFTQKQVAEFKEGFQYMDRDRDGIINKSDLRAVLDEIGKIASDKEIDGMLSDAGGPLNFTTLVAMFGARSSGETDEDDVIAHAFRAFESKDGEIDADKFRSLLMSFGDKFTSKEVDDAFEQMEMDDEGAIIDSNHVIALLTAAAKKDDADETA